jgi:organic radical activating enzyme
MFGDNPIRNQEDGDGLQLWVQDVFYTLQGEGPFAGEPSVFVRMGGCNLRCFWCDTDFESSTWRPSLDELIVRIEELRPPSCDLVVLTGGEPMRQNIVPLIARLLRKGLRVQIETNGTLWLDLPGDPRLTVVCSPKTPLLDPRLLPRIDAFKYVISADSIDPDDGLPAGSTQIRGRPSRLFRPVSGRPVYVTPCDEVGRREDNWQAATSAALKHGYRLSLQIHKLVNIP